MSTPLTPYWKTSEAEPGPWRDATTDPPPEPPIEVAWLERPAGQTDAAYQRRVSLGAMASFTGAQS